MRKIVIFFIFIVLIAIVSLIETHRASAFWVWTPETNKWSNPKYAVKETPGEQLEFALQFYNSKDYKEAIQEFNKLIKNYPRAREASEAQFYIGQTYEALERGGEAFKQYQLVIDKYPFSERSADIIKRQYAIGMELLDADNRSKWFDNFTGNDIAVLDIFRAVIKNDPYGELAAPSQYKIGLYLTEKKMVQEARDEFDKVINDYPQTEWAQAAQYQIAMLDARRSSDAAYDQKITESALKELKKFTEKYPDAALSVQATQQIQTLRDKEAESNFKIAQFYEKQKNYSAAKIYYKKILDDYQESPWSVKALKRIREISGKTP